MRLRALERIAVASRVRNCGGPAKNCSKTADIDGTKNKKKKNTKKNYKKYIP